MIKVQKLRNTDNDNNSYLISAFADSKEEVDEGAPLEGLPEDANIEMGSTVMTSDGQVALRKSDGTWSWVGKSGGGGTGDGVIIVHDLSELPEPTEELNGKIALLVLADTDNMVMSCQPLICLGVSGMGIFWTPFTLNGAYGHFAPAAELSPSISKDVASVMSGNSELLLDTSQTGYYIRGHYYKYTPITYPGGDNVQYHMVDALLPHADYRVGDDPFVIGQTVYTNNAEIYLTVESALSYDIEAIGPSTHDIGDEESVIPDLRLPIGWDAEVIEAYVESGQLNKNETIDSVSVTTYSPLSNLSDLSVRTYKNEQNEWCLIIDANDYVGSIVDLKVRYLVKYKYIDK